jgi:hypothetical protein
LRARENRRNRHSGSGASRAKGACAHLRKILGQAKFAASVTIAMRLLPKNGRFKSVFSMAEKLGINSDPKQTMLKRQQIVAEMAALMKAFLRNSTPS